MPDARSDELKGVGIYHDAKPGQVNDATDYSPWTLKPQCKTRRFGPFEAPYRKVGNLSEKAYLSGLSVDDFGSWGAERSRSRPCGARPEGLALTDEHQPYAGNGREHGLKRPCSPATRRAGEGFGRGNPLPKGSNSPAASSLRLLHPLHPRNAL
jgi:hypothetical protein